MSYLTHLTNETLIKVEGTDSKKFLQGQLTQDVMSINDNQSNLSAYCNLKGRVITLFDLFEIGNQLFLSMNVKSAEQMLDIIKKYAVFSEVLLKLDPQYHCYVLWGDHLENDLEATLSKNNIIKYIKLNTPNPSFKLFSTNALDVDIKMQSEASWASYLIQSKYPVILPENSEHFLPEELNLNALGAISLTKGCYLGQEVIARMHYLGQSKKCLINALLDGKQEIELKDKILNNENKTIGEVVNFSFDEKKQHTNVLVLINRSYYKNSSDKTFKLNGNPVTLI